MLFGTRFTFYNNYYCLLREVVMPMRIGTVMQNIHSGNTDNEVNKKDKGRRKPELKPFWGAPGVHDLRWLVDGQVSVLS